MIEINLRGVYNDPRNLPSCTGVYVVYAGRYNRVTKKVSRARVIYIGRADNIRERHFDGNRFCHEHLEDFHNECKNGESVWYGYAPVDGRSLKKVENAMIAMQQPPVNTDGKESYNHEADDFVINGVGANCFDYNEFGFMRDKDIYSLYSEEGIDLE